MSAATAEGDSQAAALASVPIPPARVAPGLAVLDPALGALAVSQDRPGVRWLGGALAVAGLASLAAAGVGPGAGLLAVGLVVRWLAPGPCGLYEGGVRWGSQRFEWDALEGLARRPGFVELRFEGLEARFAGSADEVAAWWAWLEREVVPDLGVRDLGRLLHGQRMSYGQPEALALNRAGVQATGRARLGWDEVGSVEADGAGGFQVAAGGGGFELGPEVEGAGVAAWILARAAAVHVALGGEGEGDDEDAEDREDDDEGRGDGEDREDGGGVDLAVLETLAQLGLARSQAELARRLFDGDGVSRDLGRARPWLRRAARAGDAPSQLRLARLHLDHAKGGWDLEEAAAWMERAAEGGEPEAMARFAHMLEVGDGVAASELRAREWYDKAVEAGFAASAAAARRVVFAQRFAGLREALGLGRAVVGLPDEHPELGPLVFSFTGEDGAGAPFVAYQRGVADADGAVHLGPYSRIVCSGDEGAPELVVEDDGHRVRCVPDKDVARFYEWGFQQVLAERVARALLEGCRQGQDFHIGDEYQVTVTAEGVREAVPGRDDDERVDWARYEGCKVMRDRVHVIARKQGGSLREVVSMRLDEPNAWVLHELALLVEEERGVGDA